MVEPLHASAEFRLFCLALRRSCGPEDRAQLNAAIARCRDWGIVLAGARRHRVEPLLFKGLKAHKSPDLPEHVLASLREETFAAAAANLAKAREVVRVAELFSHNGVPMIALKGVVLSTQLYGDPAVRHPRDVDLLVAAADLARAGRLLGEAGYRRAGPQVLGSQETLYWRWSKEAKFVHASSGILLELHHRLTDNPALLPFDFGELWGEREQIEMAGVKVAALPRAFLPLYLGAHGASHAWQRLCWLTDFAAALEDKDLVDRTVARAESLDLGLPMLEGLLLAHDWLGHPLREDRLAQARASRRLGRLTGIVARSYRASQWHRTPRQGSLAEFFRQSFWLRLHAYFLKRGWEYFRHQLAREMVAPSDWEAFALPNRLAWLYPAIRPFGWLVRRLRGVV
ncbi:MAG: nucleotidyltransferase domain-containing protein [Rhizomicrobium sp.]